jgi:predicted transcriptional regulator
MKDNAADTLSALIDESSMNRKTMSNRAGVAYTTVCSWLGGKNPTVDKWVKCLDALGYEVKIEKKGEVVVEEAPKPKPKPRLNPFQYL